ncbi:hypothetical protein KD146_16770 [Devosia sp. BSSL-BM10]|uniref:LPS-assembly lipoprotein n=1 Tax=Devosia litorisediminis TaxID=2829817 RepID=A0A942E931_9HYPH|nr:hypothetical protein [Devosia litorisediminis]MBS3850355.1 hypothetical protein [Devosia litorisediminis]
MSLSNALRRTVLAGFMLGIGAALGGCSFSPVYSGTLASQPSLNLAYAKPANRLEQLIYQELALRLGESTSETAPLATVSASAGGGDMLVTGNPSPAIPVEVKVTATLTITARDGSDAEARSFTRTASANYTRSGQIVADNAAADEAVERAARGAAESLRLAVLAGLNR